MLTCSMRPWDVRATRTKREIWKSGDPGIWRGCLGSTPPPGVGSVSFPLLGPQGTLHVPPASTRSHPCLRFLVSCALLSVFPALTPGISGPIKHQQHVFPPSLRPLAPGSLSFLPVLHCFSFLSAVSSLSSLLVRVSFVHHPLSKGSMYPACTVASSCFLG